MNPQETWDAGKRARYELWLAKLQRIADRNSMTPESLASVLTENRPGDDYHALYEWAESIEFMEAAKVRK